MGISTEMGDASDNGREERTSKFCDSLSMMDLFGTEYHNSVFKKKVPIALQSCNTTLPHNINITAV